MSNALTRITALSATLVVSASLSAQISPQLHPFVPLNDFVNGVVDGQAESALVQQLMTEYLDVMKGFHPDDAVIDIAQIYDDAFAETFIMGTSGFEAWGPAGTLDPVAFPWVNSVPSHRRAALQDLELWEIDLNHPQIPAVSYPINWPNPVEAFFYSARFGTSAPHVGLALLFEQTSRNQFGFVPMVEVADGGLVSASDAGAFLGMLASGGFTTTSFYDWALARYNASFAAADINLLRGMQVSPTSAFQSCDGEALSDCLDAARMDAAGDVAQEIQRHKDRVDEILEDFADGKEWELGAWAAAGAIPGAVGGSALPGVGNVAGAIGGAVVGAVGGAVGWLFSTAGDAESAQEDLDEEEQNHHDNMCGIVNDFGNDVKSCVGEHCPALNDAACAFVDDMKASTGC